jgi:hypothetical protein
MSTPAHITIFAEILSRLGNMSTTNGYSVTPRKIEQSRLKPFGGEEYPAVSFWPDADPVDKTAYKKNSHRLGFTVGYFTKVAFGDEGDTPYSNVCAYLAADVVTALYRTTLAPKVSDSRSINLGGIVRALNMTNAEYVIGPGQKPWCGVLIDFNVEYESVIGDPYSIEV